MKLADDIWLGSVAARNNLMAAANYSAAFYGNAAVQSWTLGLSAPQRFWTAMARVMDGMDAVPGNADAAPATASGAGGSARARNRDRPTLWRTQCRGPTWQGRHWPKRRAR